MSIPKACWIKTRKKLVSVNWLPCVLNSKVISGIQYPYYLCVTLQMLFVDSGVNKILFFVVVVVVVIK